MTRNEAGKRISSITSSSTDSSRSAITVKPVPPIAIPNPAPRLAADSHALAGASSNPRRRPPPARLSADDNALLMNNW